MILILVFSSFLPFISSSTVDLSCTPFANNISNIDNAGPPPDYWPNSTVFFFFNENADVKMRKVYRRAIEMIETNTCVRFVENSTADHKIEVHTVEMTCSSSVGVELSESTQDMLIAPRCVSTGDIIHELFHSLGISHTQSRSDRDDYLSIKYDEINGTKCRNFKKLSASEFPLRVPYEYGSCMHYSYNYFAMHGDVTMMPKDLDYLYTIGSPRPTITDFEHANLIYKCNKKCPSKTSAKCLHQGYPNPTNCSTCVCPTGYAGDLCDKRPDNNGCGKTLKASNKFKQAEISLSPLQDGTEHNFCTYWITTKKNTKVEIVFINTNDDLCNPGCINSGVEIKTKQEKLTSPIHCCTKYLEKSHTSILNPTPVIVSTLTSNVTYTFKYRSVPI